ncbi:hypothetical protein [Planktothricoides raciborskii]|uniref:vWA-MoxR associated protein N-terminal HTH domain-containing protein n=1 Tax=Planktothricoides raciborskii GIHE-MW2 TaxID=2792601 RepID=A0AAU8JEF6_9CYAN
MTFEGLSPLTADEALAIAEFVMDYDRFNEVQEIVFRQSWEGKSYQQMANVTDYDEAYLKAVGFKLWKKLSKKFGEKVKKENIQAVIKRYLKHHQVTLHRHQVSGVNFKGATVSNAVVGDLQNSKFCQADLQRTGNETKNENNSKINEWNGFQFRSQAAVKIAETLDEQGIVFSPNYPLRLTTSAGRKTLIFDFLIFDIGKSGILQIDEPEIANLLDEAEILNLIHRQGFESVRNYPARLCREQPETVVADFLRFLRQS